MFIENVRVDPGNPARIEIVEPGVKVDRNYRDLLSNKQRFCLSEKFRAAVWIGLNISLVNQFIVARIFPAGAIISAVAEIHIEKGIRVVVITDPARGGNVVVQVRLSSVKNLAFDLPQTN